MNKDTLSKSELLHALQVKAMERGSQAALDNHDRILSDKTSAIIDANDQYNST